MEKEEDSNIHLKDALKYPSAYATIMKARHLVHVVMKSSSAKWSKGVARR